MSEERRHDRDRGARRSPPPAGGVTPATERAAGRHQLGEFEIIGLVGEGGFGIVYLPGPLAASRGGDQGVHAGRCWPRAAGRIVSVRPSGIARPSTRPAQLRQRGAAARPVRPSVAGQGVPLLGGQRHGLHGHALLRAAHAAGRLRAQRAAPDEAWLRGCWRRSSRRWRCCTPSTVYHRDIAPDNILLLAGDRPPCCSTSARRACHQRHDAGADRDPQAGLRADRAIRRHAGHEAGAWTDVYALAAVVYLMITKRKPPAAVVA